MLTVIILQRSLTIQALLKKQRKRSLFLIFMDSIASCIMKNASHSKKPKNVSNCEAIDILCLAFNGASVFGKHLFYCLVNAMVVPHVGHLCVYFYLFLLPKLFGSFHSPGIVCINLTTFKFYWLHTFVVMKHMMTDVIRQRKREHTKFVSRAKKEGLIFWFRMKNLFIHKVTIMDMPCSRFIPILHYSTYKRVYISGSRNSKRHASCYPEK
ncbi:hypothetical protein BDC45DRAFT_536144 [Circinella umbellata]|nr:hypothetical protein BDC45DRAFT_536144 [Circinella umbellata]